jgi:hypothetical protein
MNLSGRQVRLGVPKPFSRPPRSFCGPDSARMPSKTGVCRVRLSFRGIARTDHPPRCNQFRSRCPGRSASSDKREAMTMNRRPGSSATIDRPGKAGRRATAAQRRADNLGVAHHQQGQTIATRREGQEIRDVAEMFGLHWSRATRVRLRRDRGRQVPGYRRPSTLMQAAETRHRGGTYLDASRGTIRRVILPCCNSSCRASVRPRRAIGSRGARSPHALECASRCRCLATRGPLR